MKSRVRYCWVLPDQERHLPLPTWYKRFSVRHLSSATTRRWPPNYTGSSRHSSPKMRWNISYLTTTITNRKPTCPPPTRISRKILWSTMRSINYVYEPRPPYYPDAGTWLWFHLSRAFTVWQTRQLSARTSFTWSEDSKLVATNFYAVWWMLFT